MTLYVASFYGLIHFIDWTASDGLKDHGCVVVIPSPSPPCCRFVAALKAAELRGLWDHYVNGRPLLAAAAMIEAAAAAASSLHEDSPAGTSFAARLALVQAAILSPMLLPLLTSPSVRYHFSVNHCFIRFTGVGISSVPLPLTPWRSPSAATVLVALSNLLLPLVLRLDLAY